jgi:alkylhydroperoxidase family enzyme
LPPPTSNLPTLDSTQSRGSLAYADLQKHFTEKEIVDLTLVAGMINLWNRVAISTRALPGHYKPHASAASS